MADMNLRGREVGRQVHDQAALLESLYDSAMDIARWPRFLSQLAGSFNCGTASFRVTDLASPRVYYSSTVGFDEHVNQRYVSGGSRVDLFREALARAPLGEIQASHLLVRDRDFEASEHYHQIFRPNGNFYAMGAQIDRYAGRGVHVGVHRPRRIGAFGREERRRLAFFFPHLRRAARMMRLFEQLEESLDLARVALDSLPFGVWMMDHRLHCRWMNRAGAEAVRVGLYGLGMQGERLVVREMPGVAGLGAALTAMGRERNQVQRVPLGLAGACLLLVDGGEGGLDTRLDESGGVLVFLLDPGRAVEIDFAGLRELYAFTPAELRLVELFLAGQDASEMSISLGVSVNTARTQLKSIMRKTDSVRQAELMRKLLLGSGSLNTRGMARRHMMATGRSDA